MSGEDLTPYRRASKAILSVLSRFGTAERLGLDEVAALMLIPLQGTMHLCSVCRLITVCPSNIPSFGSSMGQNPSMPSSRSFSARPQTTPQGVPVTVEGTGAHHRGLNRVHGGTHALHDVSIDPKSQRHMTVADLLHLTHRCGWT